jgi:predicted AAA+ superfamily ATPase
MCVGIAIPLELYRIAETFPILVLIGPRQVGKTSLLERTFPNNVYVSLDVATNAEAAETRSRDSLRQYLQKGAGATSRRAGSDWFFSGAPP